jgi:hypothetical protein
MSFGGKQNMNIKRGREKGKIILKKGRRRG